MTSKLTSVSKTFRKVFAASSKDATNWFPGHMAKGVKQMQRKLKSIDCIIEVHDARIPFSGRNPNFYHLLTAVRPHVLVLNKMDLADMQHESNVKAMLADRMGDRHVIFANCKLSGNEGVKKVLPTVIDLIKSGDRYSRTQMLEYEVMIIGVPNVGKSSLINALRNMHLGKGAATRVGSSPGVTRAVLQKIKISDEPPIFLHDTPGILQPNIRDVDTGMKLALCATIDDKVVGLTRMADYLLFWLNREQNFSYVDFLGLEEPCDDISEILLRLAVKLNRSHVIRHSDGTRMARPDLDAAAFHLIRAFQTGLFGKVMFDSNLFQECDL